MKKVSKILTVVFAALCMAVAFSGCFEQEIGVAKVLKNEDNTLIIEALETGGTLESALKSLKDEGKITFESETSEYGAYIVSLGGYTPDYTKNEFWAVYTTLGEYEGVSYSSAEYGTYEYDGKTLPSASYGVSGLIMVEGEIYVITIGTY